MVHLLCHLWAVYSATHSTNTLVHRARFFVPRKKSCTRVQRCIGHDTQEHVWMKRVTQFVCGSCLLDLSKSVLIAEAFSNHNSPMVAVCITSWYPKFNTSSRSHFGWPPSAIHKMTGLAVVANCCERWRMHCRIYQPQHNDHPQVTQGEAGGKPVETFCKYCVRLVNWVWRKKCVPHRDRSSFFTVVSLILPSLYLNHLQRHNQRKPSGLYLRRCHKRWQEHHQLLMN